MFHFKELANVKKGGSQEPVTRSVQLNLIPITAFSHTVLFLLRIYREFRPPHELQ